jgi:hypothetical protein
MIGCTKLLCGLATVSEALQHDRDSSKLPPNMLQFSSDYRPLVVWNTHKRYLVDLTARGVPTVPTRVLPAGSRVTVRALREETGWGDLILKAAVAQTGRYLMRVPGDREAEGQRHLDRLLPAEDMLAQPFLPGVTQDGETSLIYVDGAFSHAAQSARRRRLPVHDDFDGSLDPVTPSAAQREVAEAALAAGGGGAVRAVIWCRVRQAGGDGVAQEPDLCIAAAPGRCGTAAAAVAARAGWRPELPSRWKTPRRRVARRRRVAETRVA